MGSRRCGQLGNKGTVNGLAGQVANLGNVTAIGAGGSTGYAVAGDNSVWAWGDGSWGQLGDGQGGPSHRSLEPVRVPGLTGVTALAAATFTGYALRADGTAVAWGEGHSGELGNNTTTTISAGPAPVALPSGSRAVAGRGFGGYALRDDGTAWAWGLGDRGQLGNGTTTDGLLPAAVPGLADVIAVAGGRYTGYAITR